jgi:transcriptional regulator with XRE-family HTH domain
LSVATDEDVDELIRQLRMDKGFTYREIAKELKVSVGKVASVLKGLPLPLGKSSGSSASGNSEQERSLNIPRLIHPKNAAKIYALALDEGFEDPNKFIVDELIPWHQVKRNFEWKLRMKLNAVEFAAYMENCMLDSMELKALKEKLGQMGAPEKVTAQVLPPDKPVRQEATQQ